MSHGPGRRDSQEALSTASLMLKIGMYSAMSIEPTMVPTTTISSGSMTAVSCSVAVVTSSS
jgi:hypothetical protein